ncbi:MAG: DAK2 domain-containing protein [bacterium]
MKSLNVNFVLRTISMKILYIDGNRLKRGIIAGARRVIQMQDTLNRINVFPVPDNDTGTNMALTMQSIAEGAINCRDQSISGMSQCLADSALMGARGNSGAILAQFFYGLAESFKGKLKITAQNFGEAVDRAKKYAYEAISEPKEGTILTVIHDWAESIKSQCRRSHDFLDILSSALQEARRSLKDTPKKLKLLSKAGVVDAGAQGFVHMLEGIFHFMESGRIERIVGIGGDKKVKQAKVKKAPEKISYQYCTECMVEGNMMDRRKLKSELIGTGDSLIVAGSSQRVRIHVHTDEPETVFEIVGKYGRISKTKADDMRKQHVKAYGYQSKSKIALVTDSSCDLTPEFVIRHNIQMVPVQVSFGHDQYIDKITITPKEFYRILQESEYYPKTSQPRPGDFINTYNELWSQYETAISIHLSGALSGTLQAAQTASGFAKDRTIRVIDSRNASVALGLIVAEAAKAIEEGCDLEEVVSRTEWAIEHVRLFVSIATVEYLIRGGRVSKSRGLLAKVLNLKPILCISSNGKAEVAAKSFGGKAAMKKTMQLVCQEAMGKRNLKFAVAHANAPETAHWYVRQIKKQFKVKDIMLVKVSPALGAHVGPGAAGVAFLGG